MVLWVNCFRGVLACKDTIFCAVLSSVQYSLRSVIIFVQPHLRQTRVVRDSTDFPDKNPPKRVIMNTIVIIKLNKIITTTERSGERYLQRSCIGRVNKTDLSGTLFLFVVILIPAPADNCHSTIITKRIVRDNFAYILIRMILIIF